MRKSQPARAVWIEIDKYGIKVVKSMSQPARAVWIEIQQMMKLRCTMMSQPARAVWIEIIRISPICDRKSVTACEGCVD